MYSRPCFVVSRGDMKTAEITQALQRTAPALRAYGVEHLAIFGSRARGDAKPDSDLDVLDRKSVV